jgi:hypothetical protein
MDREEAFNSASHLLGAVLALVGSSRKVEPLGLRAQGALADGTLVGVEHDAQGLARVGSADGGGAGGRGGQELGQQRVFLAHGLGTDDGHLAIARGWARIAMSA